MKGIKIAENLKEEIAKNLTSKSKHGKKYEAPPWEYPMEAPPFHLFYSCS